MRPLPSPHARYLNRQSLAERDTRENSARLSDWRIHLMEKDQPTSGYWALVIRMTVTLLSAAGLTYFGCVLVESIGRALSIIAPGG